MGRVKLPGVVPRPRLAKIAKQCSRVKFGTARCGEMVNNEAVTLNL